MDRSMDTVRALLEEYQRLYRAPSLAPLEISSEYDLFPAPQALLDSKPLGWPVEWPNSRRKGVYLILDATPSVVYIGKASMGHTLGSRLNHYFRAAEDGSCQVLGSWTTAPRYLVTIVPPSDSSFEAAALEEYLIGRLAPPDNTLGKPLDAV